MRRVYAVTGAAGMVLGVRAVAGIAADNPLVLIALAVIAAFGTGGAAIIRLIVIERPTARNAEMTDLRTYAREQRDRHDAVSRELAEARRDALLGQLAQGRALNECEAERAQLRSEVQRLSGGGQQ